MFYLKLLPKVLAGSRRNRDQIIGEGQTLLELVDYISAVNSKFSEATMQEITKMAAKKLFRTLPCSTHDGK